MTFDGAEEEWGDGQTENVIGCCLRWADLQVRYGRGDNIQQALWSPLTPTGTRILRLTGSSMPRPQLCPPALVWAPLHLLYLTMILQTYLLLWNTPLCPFLHVLSCFAEQSCPHQDRRVSPPTSTFSLWFVSLQCELQSSVYCCFFTQTL